MILVEFANYITDKRQPNVGIVTSFESGNLFLSHLLKIVYLISDNSYVIALNIPQRDGGNTHFYAIEHRKEGNIFTRILNQVSLQVKMSYRVARLARKVDLWIFFGGEGFLLPMLTVKIFRGKVALALTGYLEKEGELNKLVLYKPLGYLKKINCTLSNRIIIYSENIIKGWNLEKHKNKILIAHEHFLDFDNFKLKKKFNERENLVGYIGRLSEEKGTLNFVKSIPLILKERDDLEFLIGGDGQLKDKIEAYLDENDLTDKVKLAGWIPHDVLPDYLNKLKLVVLPSYTEGLPNIMLEAMACGTPILATPVGAIPDIIKEEKAGFLMENNSPECIAKNVIRALEYPNLDEIVKTARELVEKEFTYEAAVERYRKILKELS
jgi:glycosyltransferase involved in cell wall biosynthesis